ncbi:NAD(P)-binding Rossmann-fold containing protein [Glarea lozoyensis ATCC 20868]|uniref:NAD(P)-binding Rossmann-fold containing protein n=2 Tax=Glarea lozoyensis TaxID=101852 RepID=S3E9S1_GLAL2|nr:NAD(P)-binding Rossmann-fold containing protein [Glarea lozoyensis ATCC 20868]EPE35078.1 NAD(P)-binding Rossmann-fold containing protein [Glarea lozoyensis ATCC 20868]
MPKPIGSEKYGQVHKDQAGAGDKRPTAQQIIKDNDLEGKLSGKTMLITGCSSGIGVETARALSSTGSTLFLTARNLPKAEAALKDILEPGRVELLEMDMNSLESVRNGAAEFRSRNEKLGGRLNVFIANAGIMALPTLEKTEDGFEAQFGVNHLAHFLLFNLVKDLLLSSSSPDFKSRVVMVSSSGHLSGGIHPGDYGFERPDNEYSPWKAYGQSKTANIYMANEITRRYSSRGLFANSLMPGGIATGLQVHVSEETKIGWSMDKNPMVKSIPQGASTTVLAAVGKDWEGVGGRYLEDCQESLPKGDKGDNKYFGYDKHAFDEEAEEKFWSDSLVMIKLEG